MNINVTDIKNLSQADVFDLNKYCADKFRKMIRQELYDSEGDYHGALGNCGVDEFNLTAEEARIIDEELSRCQYEIKYF